MANGDNTAEQRARDMLERMGVDDAQSFSAGDVVELANLIAFRDRDVAQAADEERAHIVKWLRKLGPGDFSAVADMLEANSNDGDGPLPWLRPKKDRKP